MRNFITVLAALILIMTSCHKIERPEIRLYSGMTAYNLNEWLLNHGEIVVCDNKTQHVVIIDKDTVILTYETDKNIVKNLYFKQLRCSMEKNVDVLRNYWGGYDKHYSYETKYTRLVWNSEKFLELYKRFELVSACDYKATKLLNNLREFGSFELEYKVYPTTTEITFPGYFNDFTQYPLVIDNMYMDTYIVLR